MEKIKELFEYYTTSDFIKSALKKLIFLIILDIYNVVSYIYNRTNGYLILLAIVCFVLFLIEIKNMKKFKINFDNDIDFAVVTFIMSTFVYLFIGNLIEYSNFKLIWLLIFLIILVIVFVYRAKKNTKNTVIEKSNVNVYDIKQLYDGEILTDGQIVFLQEKDVNYDLLNRTRVINDLYTAISCCKNEKSFVLSLTGKWGTGKTTILNIVKEQLDSNNFIIIDDFDVWQYNNEKTLFYAMFDGILKKTNINCSLIELYKFINTCINMVSINSDVNLSFIDFEKNSVKRIKKIINKYLKENDKRIIFIIDNLERTNAENILVVIKTIATILNLDRFIYVLSYDEEEMKCIFENKLNINYDYLEKVIQLPIKVPEINQKDIDKVCNQCMLQLLLLYGIGKNEVEQYKEAIQLFNENIRNLRDFKRKINSVFNNTFYNKNQLNLIDFLLLEVIKEDNYKLYIDIKENYKYYISEDQIYLVSYDYIDSKKFNEEATKYFDVIFEDDKNKKFINIMKSLFPNVNKYFETNRDLNRYVEFRRENPYYSDNDRKMHEYSILERRIYNAKYFNLYFVKQENEFIYIDNRVKKVVEIINAKEYSFEEYSELKNAIIDLLTIYKDERQKIILENFELYIDQIQKNKILIILLLWGLKDEIDDKPLFLQANARERLIIICAEIIKKLSCDKLKLIKKMIEKDYKNLNFIRKLLYYLEPRKTAPISQEEQDVYEGILESYNTLIENSLKINLYDKRNYSRYNIYSLMKDEKYKSQIENINKESIFMFLSDMISDGYGTNGYLYRLNLEDISKFIKLEDINKIIAEIDIDKLNDKEKFIYDVYMNYNKTNNEDDDGDFHSEHYIDLRNLN